MTRISFSVDTTEEQMTDMFNRLRSDRAMRDAFVKDPNGSLAQFGIRPSAQINGDAALAAFDRYVPAESAIPPIPASSIIILASR